MNVEGSGIPVLGLQPWRGETTCGKQRSQTVASPVAIKEQLTDEGKFAFKWNFSREYISEQPRYWIIDWARLLRCFQLFITTFLLFPCLSKHVLQTLIDSLKQESLCVPSALTFTPLHCAHRVHLWVSYDNQNKIVSLFQNSIEFLAIVTEM
jgi:hypothetical protein